MFRITPVLFAVLLFAQLGLHSGIWTYYWVNSAAVAAKHCANKDKPKLQCHGKCHMRKVTAEPETESVPRPDLKVTAEPVVLNSNPFDFPQPAIFTRMLQPLYSAVPADPFIPFVFHPPPARC